jgi:hypothetical protein
MPSEAGVQSCRRKLDSRLRGNDDQKQEMIKANFTQGSTHVPCRDHRVASSLCAHSMIGCNDGNLSQSHRCLIRHAREGGHPELPRKASIPAFSGTTIGGVKWQKLISRQVTGWTCLNIGHGSVIRHAREGPLSAIPGLRGICTSVCSTRIQNCREKRGFPLARE